MDAIINSFSQMVPVIATIISGIWYMSSKFNVVEKKCDLIDQKVDHLSDKISDLNDQQSNISNDLNRLDRKVLVLEYKNNIEEDSA
tara:strand:- start:23 stop:280 length:258 start_codon:yes stop_codon:yes gene_type:complete